MAQNKKKRIDLPLLLPLGLLLVEIIAIVVLLVIGFEITQYLLYFFIILAVYLIYQISRQLLTRTRVMRAIRQKEEGERLAEAGESIQAIQIWKKSILQLPQEQYIDTLEKMAEVYGVLNMTAAVQQTKAILQESRTFFEAQVDYQKMNPKERREWQGKAYQLREMINKLPTTK